MSALGFLGGLGSVAAGFQKGYEQSEDREQLKADREFQRQQREFEQGQQRRKIDEQTRADDERKKFAAVSTTEEVDDPNWKPTPASENPVAQVTIGDDGSETVAPTQAPQAAPKITRQRSRDAIFRDYAAIARGAGKLDTAIDLETKADKLAFDRSAKDFTMWSASASTAPLDKAAESFAQIYSADPFGGRAKVVKGANGSAINPDGSVTVEFVNKDSGQRIEQRFKSVAEMVGMGRAYFQPETFNALLKAQEEARLKANEPKVVNPGGALIAGGKEVYKNTTDRVQIGEDAEGNPIYGKPGGTGRVAGTGAGKAPKDFIDQATELLDKSIKVDSPEAGTLRSTAIRNLASIYQADPTVTPQVAQFIALDSASGKNTTLQLDFKTGQFSQYYQNPQVARGRKIELAAGAGTVDEAISTYGESKVAAEVTKMIGGLAQNVPEADRKAWTERLQATAVDPAASKAAIQRLAAEKGQEAAKALEAQLALVARFAPPAKKTDAPSEPKFTDAEKAAARKFGADPDAESIYSKAGKATQGMFRGVSQAFSVPTEAFVKNTASKINTTGRIEQSDAKALAAAFKANPPIMSLFTPEQISAIRVISREQF